MHFLLTSKTLCFKMIITMNINLFCPAYRQVKRAVHGDPLCVAQDKENVRFQKGQLCTEKYL